MRPRAVLLVVAVVGIGVAGVTFGYFLRNEKTAPSRSTGTTELIPARSVPLDMRVLHGTEPPQVGVAWLRNPAVYPWEFVLAIWERHGSTWQAVYTRRLEGDKETNLHDIRLRSVDLTLDGRDDLVVYEDRGGSGGYFDYRVLETLPGRAVQIAAGSTSSDRTTILTEAGELVAYDAVGKDPTSKPGIHCCPLYWLRTVKRWNGKRLAVVSRSRVRSRPEGVLVREPSG